MCRAYSVRADGGGPLHATVCKDRVYVLLGLCSAEEELNIQLQYDRSVTHKQVFTYVAKRLLQAGHLAILSWCRPLGSQMPVVPQNQRDPSLPSWVPDWMNPLSSAWVIQLGKELYHASGINIFCLAPDASTPLPGTLFRLDALFVGGIGAVFEPGMLPTGEQATEGQRIEMTMNTVKFFLEDSSIYTPQQCLEGIWRIRVAGREYNDQGDTIRATNKSFEEHKKLTAALRSSFFSPLVLTALVYRELLRDLTYSIIFKSHKGYVGLSPHGTVKEDEIWIPSGANVPYIFRPTANRRHVLVGEAFVYGIMHGEFVSTDTETKTLTLE
jgi:hypothetical protein